MQLLVPFAAPLSDAGRQALRELSLPNLTRLWPLLAETARDSDEETSLSAPHERALAHALGLPLSDGALPLAAVEAARSGFAVGSRAWGRLTPTHWRLGAEQLSLVDPDALALDDATSRALFDAVRELFEDEGFALQYVAPTFWLVAHPSLEGLPCASLDRVVGRHVNAWLGTDPRARPLRRLQNEAQMLLHTHPVNEAREARGELTVNSFWLSGCGAAPAFRWPDDLMIDERLRVPSLNEDWAAWTQAWQALDAGPVAQLLAAAALGNAVSLILCGERTALTLHAQPLGWLQRLAGALRKPDPRAALEPL